MSDSPVSQTPALESVWDYPRPPRVEVTDELLVVEFAGVRLAETRCAVRVLETSHPPTYYIPPEHVARQYLVSEPRRTWCEWKGQASYYGLRVGSREAEAVAWLYARPRPGFEVLAGFYAFYPGRVDACFVDGERVVAQPGDYYGGWITSRIRGPFKG